MINDLESKMYFRTNFNVPSRTENKNAKNLLKC